MNVHRFLNTLHSEMEHTDKAFASNLAYDKDRNERELTFCEWIDIYLKWMEFSTKEDCTNFYGDT